VLQIISSSDHARTARVSFPATFAREASDPTTKGECALGFCPGARALITKENLSLLVMVLRIITMIATRHARDIELWVANRRSTASVASSGGTIKVPGSHMMTAR